MDFELTVALLTLIGMEIVLGIDNLVFIAILSNRLPEHQRQSARRIGLALAVLMRFGMLAGTTWLLTLTKPLFEVGPLAISAKDLILIGGGLFLIVKATIEIHHRVDPEAQESTKQADARATARYWPTVIQILLIDMVFSVDSILAAVALTTVFWVIATAIVVAVLVMVFSMDILSDFIEANPTIVMLALAFLIMIGMVLVADGFGVHVPKGFVYIAMAFAALVEGLNMFARRAARRKRDQEALRKSATTPGGTPLGTPLGTPVGAPLGTPAETTAASR